MKRQLIIVLAFVLFIPCLIYGEDCGTKYDGSNIIYDDNNMAYVYLSDDVLLTSSLVISSESTLYLSFHLAPTSRMIPAHSCPTMIGCSLISSFTL